MTTHIQRMASTDEYANGAKPNIKSKCKSPLEQFPTLLKITQQWKSCADCTDPHPKWADISRGILSCLECSGVHRNLGTDISKVRSITLDKWTQSMVDRMQSSDVAFNEKWEYHVDAAYPKPTMNTRRDVRTRYIRAKYAEKRFHVDNHKRLAPVFASAEFDKANCDEKEQQNGQGKGKGKGMVANTGVLHIHAKSALGLPKADRFSDSDPYVVFSNMSGQSVKTKVIDDNNSPTWNERLMLSVNENEPVTIEIYDEDNHTADDLLCTATLDVAKQCKAGQTVDFSMSMKVDVHFVKQKTHPTLKFSVMYEKMDAQ